MGSQDDSSGSRYLTTREVADILRVKERKIYDLAGAGEIPHRRVTGRLLFPKSEIEAWIEGSGVSAHAAKRPDVVAGSHDPLLDWAIRESGCGLATLFDGSADGLERFEKGDAALCGMHFPEIGGGNVETLGTRVLSDCVLIAWATRSQGLIVAAGSGISSIGGLGGKRIILRQPGAGSRQLFERLFSEEAQSDLRILPSTARTETDAAQAVASGEADAALGLEAAAHTFNLGFLPLVEERFDLLINRRSYFTDPVQKLLRFSLTEAFRNKSEKLHGYNVSAVGEIRWLSD